MATTKKLVLVLHGYSQNASIFSKRLGALRKECAKDIELVFIDGPHILQPADLFNSSQLSQSAAQTQLASSSQALKAEIQTNASIDPTSAPRAWWKANRERTKAEGIEESLMAIRDVLKERKFDGILGFSQGAAFAAYIAALLERPHLHPPFLVDGQPPHPPFGFCIAVSGFKIMDPACDAVYAPHYSTPTLHVIGKTDVIVVEERSRMLVDVSANGRVEEHEGGHFVPSKGNWRKFLAEYMRDPQGAVLGAGSVSGTATPTSGGVADGAVMMKL